MSQENISEFIKRTLSEISKDFNIPESIIPDLAHLLEIYPNPDIHGAKQALSGELEKMIENLRRQGAF